MHEPWTATHVQVYHTVLLPHRDLPTSTLWRMCLPKDIRRTSVSSASPTSESVVSSLWAAIPRGRFNMMAPSTAAATRGTRAVRLGTRLRMNPASRTAPAIPTAKLVPQYGEIASLLSPRPQPRQRMRGCVGHIVRGDVAVDPEPPWGGVAAHGRTMAARRQNGDGGMLNGVVPAYPVYQSEV